MCLCHFNSITRGEKIWENVCQSLWSSTRREDVRNLRNSVGGFRKFYANCYPLIVNKDVPLVYCDPDPKYVDEWSEAEYYGDTNKLESISPEDFSQLWVLVTTRRPSVRRLCGEFQVQMAFMVGSTTVLSELTCLATQKQMMVMNQ